MSTKKSTATFWIWGLVALLVVLHQDNWLWENGTLVFGFLPMGLFYHACLSLAASLTWLLAVNFAWPDDLELLESTPAVASIDDPPRVTESQLPDAADQRGDASGADA